VPETLKDFLEPYEFATLQAMSNYNGYKTQPRQNKAELIRNLVSCFSDPVKVKQNFEKLTPPEQEAIRVFQRQGGRASRGGISRRLRDLKLIEERDTRLNPNTSQQPDFRKADSRILDEILAHLQVMGLVCGRPALDPWGHTGALTLRLTDEYLIPPPVLALLPPPPELPHIVSAEAPFRVMESSARVFQRDLYLYWSYVYRTRPDLIAKGLLAKRHLTAVNETLLQRETINTGQGEADFPRLMFTRILLTQLGLIDPDNTAVLSANNGEEFFGSEPSARVRRAFEGYLNGKLLNELTWFHAISGYSNAVYPTPEPVLIGRKAVMAYFRQTDGWTAIGALINRIRETNYEFFLPRTHQSERQYAYSPPTHPYTSSGNSLGWEWPGMIYLDESEGWQRVEAQWIAWIVTAPLYWMGLVDLGFKSEDAKTPDFFCLTALGRWLLADGPPPEIPLSGGQVIVQPDFTIMAFDPISDAVLFRLEQFSRRVSAERAILLRLSQQSVYAAQQAGWDAARIQTYLEELSHLPLPANVTRTLLEWQASHERIRIYPHVNVLHAPRPTDLDELANQDKIKPLLERTLAPGVVALPPDKKLGEVHRAFTSLSWWPVITPKNAALPPKSVTLDADGHLTCLQRSPGVYLRAHLARFAEAEGNAYRLTLTSIRRAARTGLTAPQIVEELNRVLVQPMPDGMAQRVLAWSGHFGQVEADQVTLLRFKSDSALKELQHDPELSAMLRTLRPADIDQLAIVRAKDLEKLRRLLEERGAEWKD
jgi:hypothetical protein